MKSVENPVPGWLARQAAGFRFPTLLALVAGLFFLDVLIPDLIPFVDEVLLGLLTLLLASFRKDRSASGGIEKSTVIDVEPVRDDDPRDP